MSRVRRSKQEAERNLNWEDAKIFLSIARYGQILAAARKLDMDHATASRHLNALEAAVGTRLVERTTNGCALTAAGRTFLAVAERVESELQHVQSELVNSTLSLSGTLALGLSEAFSLFLSGNLGSFLLRYPELSLELVSTEDTGLLARREVDLMVVSRRPSEGRFTVRKLTDYALQIYVGPALDRASHRTLFALAGTLPGHSEADDLRAGLDGHRTIECTSLAAQLQAVRDGLGIGLIPNFVGRRIDGLTRIMPRVSLTQSFWVVTPLDAKEVRKVNEVNRLITALCRENADAFAE